MINMSEQTPYDCRANHKAAFDDISPVLLEDHLRKTGSKLAKQVKERGVEEILEDMQLLVGPPELRYIQNVAIMMFCELVTIEIEPDCINIMNFPGIDRSISEKTIAEGKRFVSGYYRNRRLGGFLKELDLSEGHSSGIPTIQEELEKNGSPRAEFFTDEDRRAMRIRIPIHPAFLEEGTDITETEEKTTKKVTKKMKQYSLILNFMADGECHKTSEITEILGLKDTRTKELLKELVSLDKLVDDGKTKGKQYRLK